MGISIMGCLLYLFNNNFKYYLDMKNLTPIEKAKELLALMTQKENAFDKQQQKQCALIAVDEIIYELEFINNYEDRDRLNYWNEVRQEIEKL